MSGWTHPHEEHSHPDPHPPRLVSPFETPVQSHPSLAAILSDEPLGAMPSSVGTHDVYNSNIAVSPSTYPSYQPDLNFSGYNNPPFGRQDQMVYQHHPSTFEHGHGHGHGYGDVYPYQQQQPPPFPEHQQQYFPPLAPALRVPSQPLAENATRPAVQAAPPAGPLRSTTSRQPYVRKSNRAAVACLNCRQAKTRCEPSDIPTVCVHCQKGLRTCRWPGDPLEEVPPPQDFPPPPHNLPLDRHFIRGLQYSLGVGRHHFFPRARAERERAAVFA